MYKILKRYSSSNYQHIKQEILEKKVGVILLNRPSALNALKDDLMEELNDCLEKYDKSDVGCIIISGEGKKAFAAGADIKEMKDKDFNQALSVNMLGHWEKMTQIRTPIIAAVNGYALGGGCELALMCDIILASQSAKFGLPEITLGTIPGCGGTQRLIRQVGKSKAMEMILTGNMISSNEALQFGLISQVYNDDELMSNAIQMAQKIASFSKPVIRIAKESINMSMDTSLSAGIKLEKRLFHSTFALQDRLEGMTAFSEKRKPNFKDQ